MADKYVPINGQVYSTNIDGKAVAASRVYDDANEQFLNETIAEIKDKEEEFGPYQSVGAAHSALAAKGLNKVGTTVGISPDDINVTEYWYQGGTAQTNLIQKQNGGTQVQSDWNQSDNSQPDFIKNKPIIPDISGKADKSEMSVTPGTGANADKTTIQLKQGTSATVLTNHQDISGKQNVIQDLSAIRSGAAAGATAQQPATTLAGYGITDGATKTELQELESEVDSKLEEQDAAIELLDGHEVVITDDHTTVVSPDTQKIYREPYHTEQIDGQGTAVLLIGNDYYSYLSIALENDTTYAGLNNCIFINLQNSTIIGNTLTTTSPSGDEQYAVAKQVVGASDVADLSYTKTNDDVISTKYTDWMCTQTTPSVVWKKIAEYDFPGIDNTPILGSDNLVKSGGVAEAVNNLTEKIDGSTTKDIVWSNGYVASGGGIYSSSIGIFSQPILLKAGDTVKVGTNVSNTCIIGSTTADSLSIGDAITVIQLSSPVAEFKTYSYTAITDIKIVVCVNASDYTLEFYNGDNLSARIQKCPITANSADDFSVSDEEGNTIVSFKDGHIRTKKFDSSKQISLQDCDEDLQICDKDKNKLIELENGHIRTKKFDSEDVVNKVNTIHDYISAEQYNQIPVEKCGYDKECHLPICTINKGKYIRKYEQLNYIARIALFGDLHIGYGYSFAESMGNLWKNWEDYAETSLKRASNKIPDFGIALGDQLSSVNKYVYDLGGRGINERNDWYNRIRQFNYPLFGIFGNHDEALPDFVHRGVIEINNVRIIVFHMDIVLTSPFSTYNISDDDYNWLENAVKDSYNNGFITILASHYPILGDVFEGAPPAPANYLGHLLVNNHGQDLIDLCQTYNVRMHIHGHSHPTGFPHITMTNHGVPFDMTEVEIGLGARAYVILEIRNDGFHFTEYPVTRFISNTEEGGVTVQNYELLDDAAGRTLFVPLYNQASGTVRSDDWTPYPGVEQS